jgi:hypothetical protein
MLDTQSELLLAQIVGEVGQDLLSGLELSVGHPAHSDEARGVCVTVFAVV